MEKWLTITKVMMIVSKVDTYTISVMVHACLVIIDIKIINNNQSYDNCK